MNTPLAMRPFHTRLAVAYLADAVYKFPRAVKPGNTATRAAELFNHPYYQMWAKIGDFYINEGFADMADDEIREIYHTALRLGYNCKSTLTTVPCAQIAEATAKWAKCGWKRYESRRNERHRTFWRFATPVIVLGVASVTGFWAPTPSA